MRWISDSELLVEDDYSDNPERRVVFRQIGWLGQTGQLYAMDKNPKFTEPGGFRPIYCQVLPE